MSGNLVATIVSSKPLEISFSAPGFCSEAHVIVLSAQDLRILKN
jgi:hypothetical protein